MKHAVLITCFTFFVLFCAFALIVIQDQDGKLSEIIIEYNDSLNEIENSKPYTNAYYPFDASLDFDTLSIPKHNIVIIRVCPCLSGRSPGTTFKDGSFEECLDQLSDAGLIWTGGIIFNRYLICKRKDVE